MDVCSQLHVILSRNSWNRSDKASLVPSIVIHLMVNVIMEDHLIPGALNRFKRGGCIIIYLGAHTCNVKCMEGLR